MPKEKKSKDQNETSGPGPFEKLGKAIDDRPEVQMAEDAMARARDELRRAEQYYRDVRSRATDELHALREKRVADVVDDAMAFVRRRPGTGVVIAAAVGYFLGKLFRR